MNFKRESLAMFGIAEQKISRGSVNASSTNLIATGLADALVTLLKLILKRFCDRPPQNVTEADDLEPQLLGKAAYARSSALVAFDQPSTDLKELRQRATALKIVRARKASRLTREAYDAVKAVVKEKFQLLHDALERAAGRAPHHAQTLAEQVRAALQAFDFPEPDAEPQVEFNHIVQALTELVGKRSSFPKKSLETINEQLTERALAAYPKALHALSQELVIVALRDEIKSFQAYLDELLRRNVSFLQNVDAIRAEADRHRTETHHKNQASTTSVQLNLSGPLENDVIQGLMTTLACEDEQQLVAKLLELFAKALRSFARKDYRWLSENAPLGILLTHIAAGDVVGVLTNLLAQSIGDGHTFYEVVAKHGVDRLAADLFARAEETCDLLGRDIEPLNLTPDDLAIVRVAPVTGPRDMPIRQQLVAAFQKLHPKCKVVESAPDERTAIVVVRAKIGFPAGIMACNEPLLLAYLESVKSGHLPHLVGLHPDSPAGAHVPAYLRLAERIFS